MAAFAGLICRDLTKARRLAFEAMMHALGTPHGAKVQLLQDRSAGFLLAWTTGHGNGIPSGLATAEAGDTQVVFRGELFGDKLRTSPHAPGTADPNLSTLLDTWVTERDACLPRLNGWFTLVALDRKRSEVILAIDRYGLGRVFIHEDKDAFWFGSEARLLLAAQPAARRFDPVGLGEFLACGCVLQNRTLFQGVSLLPSASVILFSEGRLRSNRRFFDADSWETLPTLSPDDYLEKLRETWKRILPRYLDGSDSALSLTGGIDSRMILAGARDCGGIGTCYTFGGTYRDCADVRLARHLASICRLPHSVISVDGSFLKAFPDIAPKAVVLADGHLDVTGAIDLFVQSGARSLSPTRVTGTSGGEILRRLVAFRPNTAPLDPAVPEIAAHCRNATVTYHNERRIHPLTFTAFKQTPWHMNAKFMLERRLVRLRMPYLDNDLVALSYQVPDTMATSMDPVFRLVADFDPRLGTIPTDRCLIHPPRPLVTRIQHAISQFTFKAEYAFDTGMPQWLARATRLLAPLKPERLFLGRHKFHHFRIWYRFPLADYVRSILLDPITLGRPYLEPSRVRAIVDAHTTGRGNFTEQIHKLLTLELIERHLFAR